MDHGDIDETHIEKAVVSLKDLPQAEFDDALNRLGIAHTNGDRISALDRVRQMLHNQAELTTRMRLMGERR